MVEIKFCGMTRAEDAAYAASVGAAYVGVIFAESPRQLNTAEAREVLAAVPRGVRRVGVFGPSTSREISDTAEQTSLDVVQLHGDPSDAMVRDLRKLWHGELWAVQRVSGHELPAGIGKLFDAADAVVLDAKVIGKLGGTGVALPWPRLGATLATFRRRKARLVIAGGLNPNNVGAAVADLDPDIVDVSSGVESSVGVKNHELMRAFREAALSAVAQ
jgi:phosphoribosylanthranilate isomerase